MSQDERDIRSDPHTRSVVKKRVTRNVVFATQAGVCDTLEGRVPYKAGDAIVTGARGEKWPVGRAAFMDFYEPADGLVMGQDGAYFSKPLPAHALRLRNPAQVSAGDGGRLSGKVGDWLMRYPDGSVGILQDDIFRDTYDLIPAGRPD